MKKRLFYLDPFLTLCIEALLVSNRMHGIEAIHPTPSVDLFVSLPIVAVRSSQFTDGTSDSSASHRLLTARKESLQSLTLSVNLVFLLHFER